MTAFFLSYRRDDTRHVARNIADRLKRAPSQPQVFFDVKDMVPGDNIRERIEATFQLAPIVLVIIGPGWLAELPAREADSKLDYHRLEIERALQLKLRIVPVLVDGARHLSASELPPSLRDLADQDAHEIRNDVPFESDVDLLVRRLLPLGGDSFDDGGAGPPSRYWDQRIGRRRGRRALLVAGAGLLAAWAWRDLLPPAAIDQAALGHLLYSNCWVTYDPSEMRLDEDREPIYPSRESVAADLNAIRDAGFSGVVTTSATGVMADVPRLARERDLRVIMGVWRPGDASELRRAIRQSAYVDAYCAGGDGLTTRYGFKQLERAVFRLKKRTGRPATISETATAYDERLAAIGDWLFPDAHVTLKDQEDLDITSVDVDRDLERFFASVALVAPLAQKERKPLLFHRLSYPHRLPDDGALMDGPWMGSPESQAEFFSRLLTRLNDMDRGSPVKVSIVPMGAFDTPWKQEAPFLPWEAHAGILNRPASDEILRRFPHLKGRRKRATP